MCTYYDCFKRLLSINIQNTIRQTVSLSTLQIDFMIFTIIFNKDIFILFLSKAIWVQCYKRKLFSGTSEILREKVEGLNTDVPSPTPHNLQICHQSEEQTLRQNVDVGRLSWSVLRIKTCGEWKESGWEACCNAISMKASAGPVVNSKARVILQRRPELGSVCGLGVPCETIHWMLASGCISSSRRK